METPSLSVLIMGALVSCGSTDGDDGKADIPGSIDTQAATDTGDSGEPLVEPSEWGEDGDDVPEYYPASDISESHLALIKADHGTASTTWGNFGPIEYWIVGTDVGAAQELDAEYCEVRREKAPDMPAEFDAYCEDREYSFEDYAVEGGAGVNTLRNEWSSYSAFLVTLASKNPFPDESDYTVVTYHEYFHVVQNAHIETRDEDERRLLMVEHPWWSEGGAEYMAQLLYSRQTGVSAGYLSERMAWKMESKHMLADGERFTDIPYGDRAQIGYDLGTWFAAYLTHQVGEAALLEGFYDDLNTLGWEGSFVENFGMSSEAMLDEFELFLEAPLAEQLEILP